MCRGDKYRVAADPDTVWVVGQVVTIEKILDPLRVLVRTSIGKLVWLYKADLAAV